MSNWSELLRSNALALRGLAGRLEADPLRPVYADLDEVWIGPAASELADEARSHDRTLDRTGEDLRRVAASLDRRAADIEAAEQAAAEAAAGDVPASLPPAAPGPATGPPPNIF